LLKPEITQKVKQVQSPIIDRELLSIPSSASTPARSFGLKTITSLFGNRRSRTSAVMLGFAVFMGVSSIPTNYPATVAAAESTATAAVPVLGSGSVEQLRRDVSQMPGQSAPQSVLVAQSLSPRTAVPVTRTNPSSLQFTGEASVSIDVAQPKTRTFRAVATASPYINNADAESDSNTSEDRYPGKSTQTTIGFIWPAEGTLTSKFGRRWGKMHKGIDIAGPVGTPINAAADGTVVVAGWQSGYGNLVEIRHSDGTTTRYGHNSQLSVTAGQTVRQGQQVARMGSTGHSTGPHLHFEIRPSGGSAVNPMAHLPSNG
jgi:murein DD-endopeptidase MepM/ murein hydrolase activator NlpD